MRVLFALFSVVLLLTAAPLAYAYELPQLTSQTNPITEPSWNVGSIVKDYPNLASGAAGSTTGATSNACMPSWINAGCGLWSECEDGLQERECKIYESCTGRWNETTESRSCVTETTMPPVNMSTQNATTTSTNVTAHIENRTSAETRNITNQTGNATVERTETENESAAINYTHSNIININITVPPAIDTHGEGQAETGSETAERTSGHAPEAQRPNITRIYDVIEANSTAVVLVGKPEIPFRQIIMQVENRVVAVEIVVTQSADRPVSGMPDAVSRPEQRIYSYLEVNHTNIANENIRAANITFEVHKQWIRENGINTTTIRLSRYDGSWKELKTRMVNESEDSVYYDAESPGLSIFAIVGDQMLQYTGSVCVPLDRRCVGVQLQECKMDGSSWDAVKSCEFTCRSDRCLNATEAAAGTQEEKNMSIYFYVVIGMIIVILALGVIASHFKRKAKIIGMEINKERM